MTYQNTPVVSKLILNGNPYYVKDAEARVAIENIEGLIAGGTHFIGITSTAALVDDYTGSIVVDDTTYIPSGTPGEGEVLLVAGDIAIKAAGVGAAEEALEFIWDGAKWNELGSTGHLGSLAYVDQTTASYTPAGSVSVNVDETADTFDAGTLPSKSADTFVAPTFSEGAFTPAEIQAGFYSAGSAASFTEGAFDAGSLPSFTEGAFDAGSLPSLGEATTSNFATAGVTASYASATEELVLTDASTSAAVTAQGTFSAGSLPSKAADTFNAGTLPSKVADSFTANVPTSVDTTKFSGGSKASDSFTAGSFTEGTFTQGTLPSFTAGSVSATASFTGTAATIVADPKTV